MACSTSAAEPAAGPAGAVGPVGLVTGVDCGLVDGAACVVGAALDWLAGEAAEEDPGAELLGPAEAGGWSACPFCQDSKNAASSAATTTAASPANPPPPW